MDVLLSCHISLVLAFIVLILITATSSILPDFEASDELEQSKSICKFQRTEEVERECNTILSSTPKVKLGVNGIYKIGQSLSFQNGDWVQEDGGAPLMPFDDSDMPMNITSTRSLLKLVSFSLMGIDFAHQTQDSIGICGVLSIGITRNRTLPDPPRHWYPWFHKSPGYSDLTIVFEGLFVSSEGNEEDGLMCMLGTSVFPFSEGLTDFLTWPVKYGCNRNSQPPSMKDDRIMLVLRYPQNFTLTSRAVLGEMRSMNKRSDPKYFGNIHISSHLSYYHSNYMFASDKFVPKTCNSHLYQELDSRIDIFRGSNFCKVFQRFASEKFDVVEMCNNEKKCSTLGPFRLEDEIERKDNMLHNFRLIISDLHCVPGTTIDKVRTAKVSAILRAGSSHEDVLTSGARSGLSGMTISAEGTWNSSSGQLCMIGCVGLENDLNKCNSQISLTLPVTLSIVQRSILIGTIFNIEGTEFFSPIFFSKKVHLSALWNRYYEYSNAYLSYQYSKIEIANAFMKRSKTSNLVTLVKDMLSDYPGVEDSDNLTLLSSLSSKLSFHVNALPVSNHGEKLPKTVVLLEVLSLGKLLGRYWPELSEHKWQEQALKYPANSPCADQKLPLNISAHLTLTGDYYGDIADLNLEGLYDQFGGKMYLIGCRDVHTQHSQKIMHGNMDRESKMDCLIEVIVAYSPVSTRWLKNPTAKVSIASQRNVDDPLYFRPVRLNTFLIPYTDNPKEVVHFRRYFEDFFRIFVLLGSMTCLMGQVLYTEKKVNAIPFISLVMLTVQVLGYGLPLIMDTPVLFKWKEHHYRHSGWLRGGKTLWFQILELIIKSLLLVLLVLTLRLFQKVWNSRGTMNKLLPLDHKPRENRVLFSTLLVQTIAFLVILVSREMQTQKTAPASANPNPTDWETIMEEYWVLVQDCFLLPQILGNIIWQVQRKPLSKVYYIGFSISRFLLRAYDYLRDPVFSNYFHELETRTSPEFFSKSAKILIMMVMASLLLIVHAQQSRMRS